VHLQADNTGLLEDCAAGAQAIEQLRGIMAMQARLLPDTPEVTTASLDELVDEAVEFVIRPKDGIEIERRYAPLPRVVLDRRLVRMVIFNLVGNARQALRTLPAGTRGLELETAAPRPDQLMLVVRDSGEGFDAEARQRIGELGYSTRAGGRGIGLYSCSVALGEVGGSLTWASDGRGRGATFTVLLPCAPEPGA
jgi:signal transduction histidine kinase